ncbi:MAG: amidase [Rhodobacteraceae bacterium]|nr:amidase [Paracoccaceae bacterium]
MTDLTSLSATTLATRLANGETTAVEVMTAHLDRIDAVNPAVNAIIELQPRADLLAEAKAADAAPRKGWLHGLPFAVKNLVDVQGLPTTSGSPIFAGYVAPKDDLLAARLRAAGAIFIGKTNTPEFGLGSHSFNPVHGTTLNPYDLTRTAGGSSGGAAAALAARLVPVADGSDTMGSLRNPAAFCNIYGFRPSFGLIPGDPVGETFLNQISTEGPMARNVEDIARLLQVMAGPEPGFPHFRPTEPFADDLDTDPKGARIGWLADWGGAYPMEPGILALCESALGTFTALGAHVEPVAPPMPATQLWDSWMALRGFANAGTKAALYNDPKTRALLKPEMIWEIERGMALTAAEVWTASVIRSQWFATLATLFETYDALVLPAAQVWPFPADWRYPETINGQPMDTYHRWMEVVIPPSLVGLPALAIPAGFGANGLPMGMQLFGPRGADRAILRLGQAYHRATDWPERRPPGL